MTGMLGAELVADGGAAATDAAFFRSAIFLEAEGTTHTLVIDDGRVALPVVRRAIPGTDLFDAVSPYGYPGGHREGPAPDVGTVDFGRIGLVSLFLRESLGEPALRGGRARGAVLLHDPSVPRHVQGRTASKARSNERKGYACRVVDGHAVGGVLLAAFHAAYTETMLRAGAAERYLFGRDYLRRCLDVDTSRLVVVDGPDSDVAAAAIVTVSDGHLHYYLGGTADAHRAASPAKNLMIGMLDLADATGTPLNLGGGMAPDDSLHRFKTQFSNADGAFVSHDVVCDPEAYAWLTAGRGDAGDFFPAYRASAPRPADPVSPA
jgi:hypothetical protein